MISFEKRYDFELHTDTNEVSVKGRKVKLSPKEMGVLGFLNEHKGATISRAQLLEEVWGDEMANDQGLTQAVSRLRQVFAKCPRVCIKTVPKKGYQMQKALVKPRSIGLPHIRLNTNILVMLFLLFLIVVLVFIKRIEIRVDKAPPTTFDMSVPQSG